MHDKSEHSPPIDLGSIHHPDHGRKHWRALEETLAGRPESERHCADQPEPNDGMSRRQFVTLMGASLALAGLSGCSVKPAPSTEIVPYVHQPQGMTPGRPQYFATTMTFAGNAVGLLVESHAGRPTKVEGNPDHPASRGATDTFHQASILTFYDPDRAQTVTQTGQTRTWSEAWAAIRPAMLRQRESRGRGLRVLTETIVSPTLAQQLEALLRELPEAKWHVYEPVSRDAALAGTRLAFGELVNPIYDFHRADVVLSIDADFLQCGPGSLRYAADFMDRRRVRATAADAKRATMNRLYVVETAVSCTGAKADHRLALRPSQIEDFARAVATKLGIHSGGAVAGSLDPWVTAIASDLGSHRGHCLVVAGDRQPPMVHLLAHALNDRLGNVGSTVSYVPVVDARPVDRVESLRNLTRAMDRGEVELLLILGGNPAYTAPADLDFVKQLQKVSLRIHHGLYVNETSYQCHWHLPETHYLEAWSDARAFDGTASIVQPLVQPLYQGRSAHDVIAMFAGSTETPGREIVRSYWQHHWGRQHGQEGFEQFWQDALHDGVIANTASTPKHVGLKDGWQTPLASGRAKSSPAEQTESDGLEIVFQPDPTIYDGSWANNGWLQELPKPVTKLAWGNAAIMSPKTAGRLDVTIGPYAHGGEHGGYSMPVLELSLDGRKMQMPAWIMPGHADGVVTVYLGHGREQAGRIGGAAGRNVGFNAYRLRTAEHVWHSGGLHVVKTAESQLVACTQAHQSMEGRDLVRSATLARFRASPNFVMTDEFEHEHGELREPRGSLTLYEPFDYAAPKHRWGMIIDLTTCIGCHSCVVACQAENNIPVVGKGQVLRGREMHWLRIDRYVEGPADKPTHFFFQPVPCMHCENAPCEYVCPVEATVHSDDGLNDMVYNRCVGTRFCSNNCPYKVRRFNFHLYADYATPSRRLQFNPDVTVRSRGVMEKCSYCVQRIRRAEIDSRTEQRSIVDGEILTACQAACPVQAIVFGDINDTRSTVRRWKESPLHYGLLADLNTNPRTTYLAALRNPNPEIDT
ncbi:MAG: 4Fe-4S dicluster domain-containing protein [Planctomycetaceae bacterium]|nr:4Fe-4S dicluster domain-containing protein [Planctomycetaceae bacterium]